MIVVLSATTMAYGILFTAALIVTQRRIDHLQRRHLDLLGLVRAHVQRLHPGDERDQDFLDQWAAVLDGRDGPAGGRR